jgi:DNA-binding NarL/FixJ family response regulator
MTIRIILVDDQRFVRDGLKALLETDRRFSVIADVDTPEEAAHLCRNNGVDVVIVNHDQVGPQLAHCAEKLNRDCPQAGLIVLTRVSSRHNVVPVLQAGAKALVSQTAGFSEIAQSIEAVAQGRTFLSDHIQLRLVQDLQDDANGVIATLSERERQVVAQIADGKRTKDIANSLGVSTKTIDKCRTVIMAKLDLHSIAELTKYAVRQGLSTLQ